VWGGNSAVFLQKIEVSPAALLIQSRTQQKSFLFLLEEKIWRARNKKCRENFFAGWRVVASGGGAVQSFRSKWVRAKFRIEHQTGKVNASPHLRRVSATKSYGVFGAKRNSRFR